MFLRRKPTTDLPDEDLVAQLKAGDGSSLGILWDRYAQLLFGVGMKYMKDVERTKDVVVDLFAALPALLAQHEVQRFRPWVHAVMRNRCLMTLRKADPLVRMDDGLPEQDENGEETTLHEATLQQLETAIAELKNEQRTCIDLFYMQRKSYQQVADITGFPVEQVRSHLQNGRRNLRMMLEHHGHRAAH